MEPDNAKILSRTNSETGVLETTDYAGLFLDLAIYLPVMFLVREIYFPPVGFLVNGLFWSFSSLAVASWRMKVRGVTWNELGLYKPKSIKKTLEVSTLIVVSIIISMVGFQLIKDQLPFLIALDSSSEDAVSKFGDLKGNWPLFFLIIPMVLIESFLEELLDRGFLMNWFEKLFSNTSLATILAVVLQAVIFGFRHTYDLSERSITVGIIGLIMGIAYVTFGRNLWPLIIAHCALNGSSMLDRVL